MLWIQLHPIFLVSLHITPSVFGSDTFPGPVHRACLWTILGACVKKKWNRVGVAHTCKGGAPLSWAHEPVPPAPQACTAAQTERLLNGCATALRFWLTVSLDTFGIMGWSKCTGQDRCPWRYAGGVSQQWFCSWFTEQSPATGALDKSSVHLVWELM